MDYVVIPFQKDKGMNIHASFILNSTDNIFFLIGEVEVTSKIDDSRYVQIWSFRNEDEKNKLYKAVYQNEEWMNDLDPRAKQLMNLNKIVVHNLSPTEMSLVK